MSPSAASRSSRTRPDDGLLELGVVTAAGKVELLRTVEQTVAGTADLSTFVRTTMARRVKVRLDRKMRYGLDGGEPRRSSPVRRKAAAAAEEAA